MKMTRTLTRIAAPLVAAIVVGQLAGCAATSGSSGDSAASKPVEPVAAAPVPAPAPKLRHSITPTVKASVADLAWLHGEWSRETDRGSMTESFGSASGGVILGTSRMVQGGKAVHREFMSLSDKDGGVVYEVSWGDWSHQFALVSVSGTTAIFEDPANDFPSRITYKRTDTRMEIDLVGSGKSANKTMRFDLQLKQAAAATPAAAKPSNPASTK